jgi:cell division protein FtsN
MFAKLGLLVLIIVFGACMFVAGTMAPDSMRQPLATLGDRLSGTETATPVAAVKSPAPVASRSVAAMPLAVGSPAPEPSGTPKKGAPVRLDSLLVTAAVDEPAPDKGKPAYALQIGQFATDEDADAAVQRVEKAGLGMPLAHVATLDAENEPWTVVAIGQFASTSAAVRAAPRVQSVLGIRETPVIKLPPPAEPAP